MKFESKYGYGEEVYLTTDPDQFKRVVVSITFTVSGVQYDLACGVYNSVHYEFEISKKKDPLMNINN